MKHLLLVRHAESPFNYHNCKDFDRPLNNQGIEDAKVMATQLIKNKFLPDLIVSSGANRALTTSQIIAKNISYQENKIELNNDIYNASIEDVISILHNVPDKYEKIMLTGHNPAFHLLSQTLSGTNVIKFPPCCMFLIQFNIEFWSLLDRGEKQIMIYPQLFR